MKKLGIIGGLSCESSAEFYLKMARKSNRMLGCHFTSEILMHSINTGEILELIKNDDWDKVAKKMVQSCKKLEKMGADCISIPCNTIHKIYLDIEKNISIPLLNIMDGVGYYAKRNSYSKITLLGTRFTLEDNFYRNYLEEKFDLITQIPNRTERRILNNIIFDELVFGKVEPSSQKYLNSLCHELNERDDSQAIVLACSELSMLVNTSELNIIDSLDVYSDFVLGTLADSSDRSIRAA